ncbi:MAG: hypothetical protein ACM31G_07125 [Flavobacteriales bacterium]
MNTQTVTPISTLNFSNKLSLHKYLRTLVIKVLRTKEQEIIDLKAENASLKFQIKNAFLLEKFKENTFITGDIYIKEQIITVDRINIKKTPSAFFMAKLFNKPTHKAPRLSFICYDLKSNQELALNFNEVEDAYNQFHAIGC